MECRRRLRLGKQEALRKVATEVLQHTELQVCLHTHSDDLSTKTFADGANGFGDSRRVARVRDFAYAAAVDLEVVELESMQVGE